MMQYHGHRGPAYVQVNGCNTVKSFPVAPNTYRFSAMQRRPYVVAQYIVDMQFEDLPSPHTRDRSIRGNLRRRGFLRVAESQSALVLARAKR